MAKINNHQCEFPQWPHGGDISPPGLFTSLLPAVCSTRHSNCSISASGAAFSATSELLGSVKASSRWPLQPPCRISRGEKNIHPRRRGGGGGGGGGRLAPSVPSASLTPPGGGGHPPGAGEPSTSMLLYMQRSPITVLQDPDSPASDGGRVGERRRVNTSKSRDTEKERA
ncbi:hypothetical protein EYF80_046778 [Liparis tanakae]|uniref:Uncharacterized protein n=1 Tax=Liparis tanakae TaxID=230148 RepID=A0A4Z2FPH9_9TELE|nr:hypothetical protein EYF80_046778 [Liparis tanakae]